MSGFFLWGDGNFGGGELWGKSHNALHLPAWDTMISSFFQFSKADRRTVQELVVCAGLKKGEIV